MNDIISIYNFLLLLSLVIIGTLVFITIQKADEVKKLEVSLSKLLRSFDELDEQAKLIVKTDLALNKAQEELDKRLRGLNALQRTSQQISKALNENDIFKRLDSSLMKELGFSKSMVILLNKDNNLYCRIFSGFRQDHVTRILENIKKNPSLIKFIQEENILSSLRSPAEKRQYIQQIFQVNSFILCPILTQEGIAGAIFVGNDIPSSTITEGDEELISILANQIGQSLENAKLFEKVYRSSQELEIKVQERTKELAKALEEVKKVSKIKSEFVSAVSHELRTPLTSIKGYASILMTGKLGAIPDKVKERLEKINKHSDNLVKLINDLLDVSRIESGRVEMKMEECSVHQIVENVRDLLMPQMKEKKLNFVVEINPNVPSLLVDKNQFERIFINLISNAIKFTPEGGQISIKASQENGQVLFEVSDTGIGIPEEDIPKLFNEFYRVDNDINLNVKGTGLGLALVKNIVEAHKGKIWVTSKVNGGTTFHFTIPITRPTRKTV